MKSKSCTKLYNCKQRDVPVNLLLYALIVDRLGMLHQLLGNEPAHLHVFSIFNTSVNAGATKLEGLIGGSDCSATTSLQKT